MARKRETCYKLSYGWPPYVAIIISGLLGAFFGGTCCKGSIEILGTSLTGSILFFKGVGQYVPGYPGDEDNEYGRDTFKDTLLANFLYIVGMFVFFIAGMIT
jgi:hypothetical protein